MMATIAMMGTAALAAPAANAADENANPDVELAAFWSSDDDLSDTVYMSTNGSDFKRLSTAYQADGNKSQHVSGAPSYVNALHDPGLFYTNGNFWMISGYVQNQPGLGNRFTPMLGSSKDLIHWSYPNSGSPTNIAIPAGTPRNSFNTAGTDAMADGDGTAWIVTTIGYYGTKNHDSAQNDEMKPYIVKATGLQPGADQQSDPGAQPKVSYGELVPINLPDSSTNWLDPSLYKEDGTYYLSIKRNGITNQIYSINDLNRASDASAWTPVNSDVITGYEGPSLTKFKGKYFMYADKLKDYPPQNADGKAGVHVIESTSLTSGWNNTHAITTTDENGNAIPNRHGSVITVTDEAAKSVIWNLAKKYGYKDDSSTDNGNNGNGNNGSGDNGGFIDVNAATPHVDDIAWLKESGITVGYSDGTFSPAGVVNRQDMAAFLYRLAGSPKFTPDWSQNKFADVNSSSPHAKEVLWLAQTGISTGYVAANGTVTFQGTVPVFRQDMAAFLKRLADYEGAAAPSGNGRSFIDVNADTPHADDIAWLSKSGVASGYGNGTFGVGGTVLRQDMAAFLHRMKTNVLS
ncbi:S-layer homology domain-containing protein [Bifidobacterium callitrichidarum]|nr:S-layer homology domain-containing protein [Bifidobacterium callitrichidarum]